VRPPADQRNFDINSYSPSAENSRSTLLISKQGTFRTGEPVFCSWFAACRRPIRQPAETRGRQVISIVNLATSNLKIIAPAPVFLNRIRKASEASIWAARPLLAALRMRMDHGSHPFQPSPDGQSSSPLRDRPQTGHRRADAPAALSAAPRKHDGERPATKTECRRRDCPRGPRRFRGQAL